MAVETHVLVVDGDTDFAKTLCDRLGQTGVGADWVDSVETALERLERDGNTVHAIVSEIEFGEDRADGLALLEEVKRRCWRQPVIFVSSATCGEAVKGAIWAGAFEYYDKPVDFDALAEMIRTAMRSGVEYIQPERRNPAGHGFNTEISSCSRDQLTGAASHRCILEMIPKIRDYFRQKNLPLSMCMIDIDGFRELNTRQGFALCDRVLVEFTRRLRAMIRFNDIIGRYGGDEFIMLLPGASADDAHALAQRLIDGLREKPLYVDGVTIRLPVCVGVVQLNPDDQAVDLEFVDRAIEAVYYAKLAGAESVITWRPGLIHETLLWGEESAGSEPAPDMESINIMAWRFREMNRQLSSVTHESLRALVAAVEARDPYTKNHSIKVAALSRQIAEELGLPARQIDAIHSAGLLHDIGKIGIPDAILTKPGRLTDDERDLIMQHPDIGVNILQQTRFFAAEMRLIKHHHERYDGNGYPDRLRGEDIPFGSRIIHIADAVEAMIAARSYKKPYPLDFVSNELRQGAGSQFDPVLVELAAAIIDRDGLDEIWNAEPVAHELVPVRA